MSRDCSLLSCGGIVPDNRLSFIYLSTSSLYCPMHTTETSEVTFSPQNQAQYTALGGHCTSSCKMLQKKGVAQLHKPAHALQKVALSLAECTKALAQTKREGLY